MVTLVSKNVYQIQTRSVQTEAAARREHEMTRIVHESDSSQLVKEYPRWFSKVPDGVVICNCALNKIRYHLSPTVGGALSVALRLTRILRLKGGSMAS